MRGMQRCVPVRLRDEIPPSRDDRRSARRDARGLVGQRHHLDVRLLLRLHSGLPGQDPGHRRVDHPGERRDVISGKRPHRTSGRPRESSALFQSTRRITPQTSGVGHQTRARNHYHGQSQTTRGCTLVRRRLRLLPPHCSIGYAGSNQNPQHFRRGLWHPRSGGGQRRRLATTCRRERVIRDDGRKER